MEEEFFAVIKLISGEEIFSKVCPCEEDERTLLILENPVTVETVNLKQFGIIIENERELKKIKENQQISERIRDN